jgi:endonuclease YncB( thermonuclease family)
MSLFKISTPFLVRVTIALVLVIVSAIALGSDFTDVEYLKNYDGDTLTVNIKDLPDVFGKEIPVRIRGVDTPEMNASRNCERKAADDARRFLRRALSGTKIRLLGCERDKYFRLLCTVKAGEVDIGERILKGRWGIAYDGGTKADWYCGNPEKQD